MSTTRVLYRTRQFWHALFWRPAAVELELAELALNRAQLDLFLQMQPNEQAHSLQVLQALLEQGHTDPDLQAAALLHDAGKSRFPLSVWERVLIVLVRALFPRMAARWGRSVDWKTGRVEDRKFGWRRAFVVAENHPRWGAEMAAAAGSSPLAVALIRRHQEKLLKAAGEGLSNQAEEDRLLRLLQSVDDES